MNLPGTFPSQVVQLNEINEAIGKKPIEVDAAVADATLHLMQK